MAKKRKLTKLFTVKEAAELLGYSEGALYNMMSRREIPFVHIRKRGQTRPSVRFRECDLLSIIEEVPTVEQVVREL